MSSEDLTRRDILTSFGAAAAIGVATARLGRNEVEAAPIASSSMSLRKRADRKGLLCGNAVWGKMLAQDKRLADALRTDSNILVPEVELKWPVFQPVSPDVYDFSGAEQIYAFAKANKMKMRGHTLSWYRGIPKWAPAMVAEMTPAQAETMLTNMVSKVVGHWRGRIIQWDVANEAIDGRQMITEPLFSTKLGERYLDIAYHTAHEADPAAELVFNTDLIEMDDPYQERHRNATLRLLERMLKRGVPVHALGVEGHLITVDKFSERVLRNFLDEITGMGLKLMVTEFDINDRGTIGTMAERDAAVASLGKAFLDVMFSYRQCGGVLTWSITDKYSWIRTEKRMQRTDQQILRPSPLDENFQRKPLWAAMAAAIDGAPAR